MRLIRHTRPDIDEGRCYGRLDIGLAAGWDAAVAACLAQVPPVVQLYSSPSRRCRILAEALARRDGVEVQVDTRLSELDFGAWEGLPWSAIEVAALDAWAADLWHYAPGGGESLQDLWARIDQFRAALPRDTAAVAVIAHHGPLRALAAQVEGRPWQTLWNISLDFGACLELSTS